MTDTTARRLTAQEWIDANPAPEPVIPEGNVACGACDGTGTQTYGYAYGQPIDDRCSWCNGFGHKPAPARISTLTTTTDAA